MIFRAFFGEPCRGGARARARPPRTTPRCPRNPMTGEEEDTDVGFPGPEHHIAEREWPMKVAMGALALLAVIGGLIQIPGVDDGVTKFLEPTFADSTSDHAGCRRPAPAWIGLVIGAADRGGRRSRSPTGSGSPSRGTSAALRERFGAVHTFLCNKWYFDELIDFLIVRPVAVARPLRRHGARARRHRAAWSPAARSASSAPARPRSAAPRPASCATTPPR